MVLTVTGEFYDERGTKVIKTVVYTGPPSWRKCSWRESDRQADFLLSGSWHLSNFKAGAGLAFPSLCICPVGVKEHLFNYCFLNVGHCDIGVRLQDGAIP
jgi:hypothetical protein